LIPQFPSVIESLPASAARPGHGREPIYFDQNDIGLAPIEKPDQPGRARPNLIFHHHSDPPPSSSLLLP
jgi:hypothetical protein